MGGRTSRASLHTEAHKLVLPSFERSGGGLPYGECGDAWPIRPLKYGASKYINKRISKQVVGGAHSPHAPMPVTSAILHANLSHFAVQSHPFYRAIWLRLVCNIAGNDFPQACSPLLGRGRGRLLHTKKTTLGHENRHGIPIFRYCDIMGFVLSLQQMKYF